MTAPVPVPVSQFPAAGTLNGSEIVPVVKNGTTSRTTTQDIANLASGGGAVDSVNGQTGVVVLGAADVGAVPLAALPLDVTLGGTGQITANAALNALLPNQTGQNGKVLQTNGTNTSWANAGGGSPIVGHSIPPFFDAAISGTFWTQSNGAPLTTPGTYVATFGGSYFNSAGGDTTLSINMKVSGVDIPSFGTMPIAAGDSGNWQAQVAVTLLGDGNYQSQSTIWREGNIDSAYFIRSGADVLVTPVDTMEIGWQWGSTPDPSDGVSLNAGNAVYTPDT